MQNRAVLYCRYSSENQREESIKGQIRECTAFAQRKGYTVVKHYVDRAISGKKADNRPDFMQMVSDSKASGFDFVIVWKLDRFSRDKYDSVYYKNVLKKNGVSVISATEPIDDSPEGQLMESIFEGFSAYYIKDLAMKVNRGMTENVLKHKYNGGVLTYGYYIDADRHFQPDPVKSLIVADIFRRYAMGESTKSIVASLNEQGIKTNNDKEISYTFIAKILTNRRYLGEYRYKDTIVENAFTPLVAPEIFEKCQKRMTENQRRPGSFKPVQDKYLLTGKIFCGICGSTMSGESATSRSKTTHRYYACHAAKRKKTCAKKRTSKDFIEAAVVDIALRLLNDAPVLNYIVDGCFTVQLNANVALPALEQQIKKNQTEIDNVMNAIKAGIITPTTKSTLEALESEKETLALSIAREKIERPIIGKEEIKFRICQYADIDVDDIEQRQGLINFFVNSVYVYDDKLVVSFNYTDGDACLAFDEINDVIDKKTNPDNHKGFRGSSLNSDGGPSRTRTADQPVMSELCIIVFSFSYAVISTSLPLVTTVVTPSKTATSLKASSVICV